MIQGKLENDYAFPIDRESATPVYRQIADHVYRLLAEKRVQPGTRLPPEESLTETFGVTRTTLRRALKELVRMGVVVQAPGRGTFYGQARMIVQPLASSLISFSEAMRDADMPFTTRLLSATTVQGGSGTAEHLRGAGELYCVRRVRSVEGEPVILLENYLPTKMFPDLLKHDLEGRELFEVLRREYHTEPFDGTRTFEAALAHRDVAPFLGVAIGEPVMQVEQVTRRADGTTIEVSNLWLPARRFKLTAHIYR